MDTQKSTSPYVATLARSMHRKITAGEEVLWAKLAQNFPQLRFRRQHLIGTHTADFYCRKLRLIIDLGNDGLRQRERDAYLTSCGYSVLRISNADVKQNVSVVLTKVNSRIRFIKIRENVITLKEKAMRIVTFVPALFVSHRTSRTAMAAGLRLSIVS